MGCLCRFGGFVLVTVTLVSVGAAAASRPSATSLAFCAANTSLMSGCRLSFARWIAAARFTMIVVDFHQAAKYFVLDLRRSSKGMWNNP
jgi:hypothetical protein